VIIGGSAEADTAWRCGPHPHVMESRTTRPHDVEPPSSVLLPAVELSLQPGPHTAEEEFCPRYYEGQREMRRVAADVDRLRYAIVDLAAIELEPSRLFAELDPTFDKPVIRDRLIRAIDCLSQFAEEWRLDELAAALSSQRGIDDD